MSKRKKVVLVERMGRLQSFNLPHDPYCEARGVCSCTVRKVIRRELDKRTGKPNFRSVEQRTSKSFTLLPRKESEPLDAAVLQCPDVDGALRARLLLRREV
jgi:hypothetical protein